METTEETKAVAPAPEPNVLETIQQETPVSSNKETLTPWYIRHKALIIASLIALIILGGAGYYLYSLQYGNGKVVARVGETKIYETEYLENLTLIEETAKAQGLDPADSELQTALKKQTMDILVSNALLIDAAEAAGTETSEDNVKKMYNQLVAQRGGEEAMLAEIAEVGITKEKLMSNIRDRVMTDAYIASVTDIESIMVTDEEISSFLGTLAGIGQELPPLEEIKPQVESRLLGEKRQKVIDELLEKLRSETEIEILI